MSETTASQRPRVSRIRVTVLAFILVAVLAMIAWNARTFFRLNHIDFLLNQRDFEKGLALLDKLDSGAIKNPRAGMLRAKALTLIGNYEAAIAAANTVASIDGSPPAKASYWKALAQFQAGETTASQQSAAQFLTTGKELPNGTKAIATALAGESVLADIPTPDSAPFRMMFPVEQATYLALAAMQQAELGRFDLAARVYERAFILGNRNTQSLQNASLVSALIGDVHGAKMYADFAGTGSMRRLRAEVERRYSEAGEAKLTLQGEDLSPGRRRADVARALAWATVEVDNQTSHGTDQGEVFSRLLQSYSTDPVLKLAQADHLANTGRTTAALAVYRELQQSDPTLATQLKIISLTSGSQGDDISNALQPLLEKLNTVAVLRPQSKATSFRQRPSGPALITAHQPAIVSFNLESRGSYLVSIVARATDRHGKWPLLYAKAGHETVGLCYISGENWAIYSVKAPLEPGPQQLEFTFNKDDESPENEASAPGEVAWAMVIITGSGAPD